MTHGEIQPIDSAPVAWRGEELPEEEGFRRNAKLAPVLGLVRLAPLADASLAVLLARTADIAAEDFDAAVDWLADNAESITNPIPALRRAAAANADLRRQERAKRSDPKPEEVVPMPDDVRERIAAILRRRDAPVVSAEAEQRKFRRAKLTEAELLARDEEGRRKLAAFKESLADQADGNSATEATADARAQEGEPQ